MRPGWKRVAERAYNRNFDPAQIREAVLPALAKDCRIELSEVFLSSFRSVYDTLPKDDLPNQLEGLRSVAGAGLGRTVLDYAIQHANNGATGATAEQALASALAGPLNLSAFQLGHSLGLSQDDARAKLDRLLQQHESEWKAFVQAQGPNAFIADWAVHAS